MSFKKTAAIAAALMLSGSYSAMAATLFVPTNGGIPLANELFGTSVVSPAAVANSVRIESSGVGTFTDSIMRVTFALSGGASFANNVVIGNLTGDANTGFNAAVACGTVPTVSIQAGGLAGESTVTFEVTNASSCRALRLNLTAPGLKGITQGSTVSISASLTTQAGAPVDSNVINSPLVYLTQVDANTGSITSVTTSTIDLATSNKNLVASATATANTFVSGLMNDKLATAFTNDVVTQWKASNNGATGSLVLSGIPAAVTAAPVLRYASMGATLAGHAAGNAFGGGEADCTAPVSGTSTCTFTNAGMVRIADTVATGVVTALFTVNGTTAIPTSTINGKFTVSYATAGNYKPIASEVKFDGPVANLGFNACAAEFASMMGAKTTNALTTVRLTNTSAAAGRVWATATDDKGVHSNVVQITKTNGGASATAVLDANDLLPAGATVELLGTALEAATMSFDSWSGTTRGRARVYVETAGSATASSLGSAGTSGCKAEAWMCINGTCSIVNQTGNGTDGQQPVAQKN